MGFRERMSRGLGVAVLFAGESGTGKTMAAEVLASELRPRRSTGSTCPPWSSKYIGETEKNLRRLFDAAESGGAILFFDEADALFGKRSEVKDSHDRYANIEINYLLQRIESLPRARDPGDQPEERDGHGLPAPAPFRGQFPVPGHGRADRRSGRACFRPNTPRGELDLDRLARLNLSGGSIHNVALNAASSPLRRRAAR